MSELRMFESLLGSKQNSVIGVSALIPDFHY